MHAFICLGGKLRQGFEQARKPEDLIDCLKKYEQTKILSKCKNGAKWEDFFHKSDCHIPYDPDQYKIPDDLAINFLSGENDTATPPSNAEALTKDHAKSKNSIFRGCGHTALDQGRFPCEVTRKIFDTAFNGEVADFSNLAHCSQISPAARVSDQSGGAQSPPRATP